MTRQQNGTSCVLLYVRSATPYQLDKRRRVNLRSDRSLGRVLLTLRATNPGRILPRIAAKPSRRARTNERICRSDVVGDENTANCRPGNGRRTRIYRSTGPDSRPNAAAAAAAAWDAVVNADRGDQRDGRLGRRMTSLSSPSPAAGCRALARFPCLGRAQMTQPTQRRRACISGRIAALARRGLLLQTEVK